MPRKIGKPLGIQLSSASYEVWLEKLSKFFETTGLDSGMAIQKAESILTEAQKGWPHAPKDINIRIKMKSGYDWSPHKNLKSNPEYLPNVQNANLNRDNTINDLYKWENNLADGEKNWWAEREAIYRKEFEFNKSSDEPLLFQLLTEELNQKRLATLLLENPRKADLYSKFMTDSLKRLQETQIKLGITREQRADLLENAEGDISSLSIRFEDKIAVARAKIKEWEKEQAAQKFVKEREGINNVLPAITRIEALLGIDPEGNIKEDVDTQEVAELIQKDSLREAVESKPAIKEYVPEN
jgi:hypothetical protein